MNQLMMIRTQNNDIVGIVIMRLRKIRNMMCLSDINTISINGVPAADLAVPPVQVFQLGNDCSVVHTNLTRLDCNTDSCRRIGHIHNSFDLVLLNRCNWAFCRSVVGERLILKAL